MYKLTFLLLSFFLFISAQSQSKVKWLSVEKAMELYEKNPKPLFIDVYTDWCGYCKVMDKKTFQDSATASYINSNFYPVKFDAESDVPLTFKDSVYKNEYKGKLDSKGRVMEKGLHSFAIMLLQGKMSYPTIVYFLPNEKILAPIPGYKTPQSIKPYLLYFGEGIYLLNRFEAFKKGLSLSNPK